MKSLIAFVVVMGFLALGDLVSASTKAYVPSMFVTAICFLVSFWLGMPKDIVQLASFTTVFIPICMSLLLVHLGTLMNLRKLLAQWRAVSISIAGVIGTVIISMTIGRMLFDHNLVVSVTPPLVGGLVATTLMSKALADKGLIVMAALPVTMFMMHGFAGYPVTSWCLKREGLRLIRDYREHGVSEHEMRMVGNQADEKPRKKLFPPVPEKYFSPFLVLFKLICVGLLAAYLEGLTNKMLNQYIICLVLGVVFCELGILEEQALNKAGVFNWLMGGLLAFVFAPLSALTPDKIAGIILPICTLLILGIIGMGIISAIIGPRMGFSREMSFACALTALFGFPADYVITDEVCKSIGKDEKEYKYLMDIMLPKMLVGGFATVTIASVVIASVFVGLIR